MTPTAIISCNNAPEYLFVLPVVIKSWELQGWAVDLLLVDLPDPLSDLLEAYAPAASLYGFSAPPPTLVSLQNPALFTQLIRLYWPLYRQPPSDAVAPYLLTSDADMFIGSGFLNRDYDKVNVFGFDLTNRTQVPVCYAGATQDKWVQIMGPAGPAADLLRYADKDSPDWYKAWGADQDILTAKLKAYGFNNINFITRGIDINNAGLPLGRLDRFNWTYPAGPVHDAHLMRNPYSSNNLELIIEMATKIYPAVSWEWVRDYRKQFLEVIKPI